MADAERFKTYAQHSRLFTGRFLCRRPVSGVKVLLLFFIDEVAKYRDYTREDALGDYAWMFEEEYGAICDEVLDKLAM
ncbi:hypothetical protein [Actinomyces minihominis]|uniref:hypothetical protein n=1 Tax=Actinomyces minihominis TaxID=2002838 RepID=UPI000C073740|nr:hypothetical protein [Actinomyces minihominis]